jgi:DNA-binding transcriptional ArsR family regulator
VLDHDARLDLAFQALADPTRRAMLDRLTAGPRSASDLAVGFTITLAAVLQHLRVLEASGLVHTKKEGRVRMCSVDPAALRSVEDWIAARRTAWERRLDRLGALLTDPSEEQRP